MTIAKTVVQDALYLSLYDEVFQPAIDNGLVTSALAQFNLMLDEYRDKIPYTFQYQFTDVNDLQNTTFVTVDKLAYVINGIVFPMACLNLVRYREIAVVEGLVGIPMVYFFDESTQSIEVYPMPSNPSYAFILNGRRALGPLALEDNLPPNMTQFMQNALTYELAFRLCGKFNAQWNESKEFTRQQLMKGLLDKRVIDLTPQRNLIFGSCDPSIPPFPEFFYVCGGGQ